ncbi:MAG: antirestriction protein [Candidatus Thiodiazotropha sp.]
MITKTLIRDTERLKFLPDNIGSSFLKFEMLVYGFMENFCDQYQGGYWNFYALSNNGLFMSLESEKCCHIVNPVNYFDDTMTAEAASIGVNIFALNALVESRQSDRLITLYYALRDYAAEHGEAEKIFQFID